MMIHVSDLIIYSFVETIFLEINDISDYDMNFSCTVFKI